MSEREMHPSEGGEARSGERTPDGAGSDGTGASARELPVLGSDRGRDLDRRTAIKLMAAAAAAGPAVGAGACGPAGDQATGDALLPGQPPADANDSLVRGTPTDPDLLDPEIWWERLLTPDELEGLASLCDVILPADERSPAASALDCHGFIDEWVSAPYEGNQRDLVLVRGGLVWLDRESARRFGEGLRFRDLTAEQQRQICDNICYEPDAAPGLRFAARFFDRVRDLTSSAFWTTREGMADLEYVGNVPLDEWGPPPPEVLRHLGLA